jgi:methionine sulfoxide reductase heme-binding subunit
VTHTHTWWYLARAGGLVAWALLSISVLWGLLLSTRVFDRSISPKWITDLHRFLGGTAVLFTVMHVGTLVADSYVHFGAKEVLVPLASSWRPIAVAWGVIAFWIVAAVEATSLLMKHLPRRVWHAVHLSSFVLFFSATAHAITAGTDTRSPAFVISCTAVISTVLLLTLVRVLVPRKRGASSARVVNDDVDRAGVAVEAA